MPKGRQCAEYSLECTSTTCTAGPAGEKILALNFWGDATGGLGTLVCTVTIDTSRDGRMDFCGVSFEKNGDLGNASGHGFCRTAGKHRWATQLLLHCSDGDVVLMEGLLDLATNTMSGIAYEWITEDVRRPAAAVKDYRDWLPHQAA